MGSILIWLGLALLGAAAGTLLVGYLVANPTEMALYAVLLAAVSVVLIWYAGRFFPRRGLLVALPAALAAVSLGYLVSGHLFLAQEEHRELPALALNRGSGEPGHTAIIYLTHGEPPGYSPMPWLETFREFDANKTPFMPTALRPFFFYGFRGEYLKTGGSPHNYVHMAMSSSLEEMLRREGDTSTRIYTAFLDSNPRPDEMAIRAVNDGASRLVISHVFLTISSHTQAGMELVKALDLPQYGIEICETEPLWSTTELKEMFLRRADRAVGGGDKSKVGILLVGHGQPISWDAIYPRQTSQEQQFREEVMDLLAQNGYSRKNISLAWMEFRPPEVGEKARELAEQGVEKILVFSAAISAPSLHSEYDVPELMRKAKLPAGVEVVNLGAWGDDPLVIEAIREQLRGCGL